MAEKRCPSCLREYDGGGCSCGYPEKGQNASHQLPVGTVLRGRYMIGKALGQGGFGITYLAWDKLMQQSVAVKEFYPGGTVFRKSATSLAVECGTEEIIPHYEYSKERFLREAGALVKFKDIPEIVDILDFAEENNTAYIVMEYVRGMDLAKYIKMKGGKLSPEETFRILRPVMEALAKVHKGGIVHRDISPDNIILDPMGGAKLLDFGAVRAVEDPDVDKGLNKSTEAILKQGFAPIEQYNTRGNLGPWTDEYAVCATVWYCLTGTVPAEASIRVSEGIDPDWAGIPGLPEHQQKALEKGIACRAKDRFRSLDELLEALFPKAEMAAPVEVSTVTEPKSVEKPKKAEKPPREKKPKGKKTPLLFVAAAATVLILIAAFVLIPGKQEGTSPAQLQDTPGTLPSEAPGETQPNAPETVPTTEATDPPSEEELAYQNAEALLAEGKLGEAAIAFGKLARYSDARERSFEIWDKIAFRDTITAGHDHTVGLKTDGTVVALGNSNLGRCDVTGWSDIVAVCAGSAHTVGLRTDGTVVAIGDNYTNEQYVGGRCDVESWTDIVAISAGRLHSVGLCADGTVVAVGSNSEGQCEVDAWTDIVAISAGGDHTVGLRADGTVVAVGYNEFGQCDVSGWTDIVAISAGGNHTVGLMADGSVIATGVNGTSKDYKGGQCDVADWSNVAAIATGWGHTVGLKTDSTVLAVGFNMQGQCRATTWGNIVAIAAGEFHTVGLLRNGHVIAEGSNVYGQCRLSDWTDIRIPQRVNWYAPKDRPAELIPPISGEDANAEAYANAEQLLAEGKLGEAAIAFGKLAGYSDAKERSFEIWAKIAVRETIGAGAYHTVGLKGDGTVVAVGNKIYDQCDVNGWTDIVAVSAAGNTTVGLRADGTVIAVGWTDDVSGWTDIVAVSTGSSHIVGLKTDGTVVAVGDNTDGECRVEDWTDIVAISAGYQHTVGLKADGTLVAVGNNEYGQCDVSGWTDIAAVSAGSSHTVGLKLDGTVVAVGDDSSNQCDVSDWTDTVAVSAGTFHTVGLRADGTVVTAGANYSSVCNVSGWADIVAVDTYRDHTVGLRADGMAVAVGYNAYGQCNVTGWPMTDILLPQERLPFR